MLATRGACLGLQLRALSAILNGTRREESGGTTIYHPSQFLIAGVHLRVIRTRSNPSLISTPSSVKSKDHVERSFGRLDWHASACTVVCASSTSATSEFKLSCSANIQRSGFSQNTFMMSPKYVPCFMSSSWCSTSFNSYFVQPVFANNKSSPCHSRRSFTRNKRTTSLIALNCDVLGCTDHDDAYQPWKRHQDIIECFNSAKLRNGGTNKSPPRVLQHSGALQTPRSARNAPKSPAEPPSPMS